MKKSLVPWLLPLSLLPLVSCIHTGTSSSDLLSFSTDQTVMLHWLEVDDEGLVREAETDGNETKQQDPFSGKAMYFELLNEKRGKNKTGR